MKSIINIFVLVLLLTTTGYLAADTWNYNFGTGTGSFNVAGQSTTFLPAPPSGTARVRVGTSGGSVDMKNPGLASIGSATELQITAPTDGQYNKFAIYDYTPSQAYHIKFSMLLGSVSGGQANSGIFYFVNGDGGIFSNNSGLDDVQCFTALRMTFGAGGIITLDNRKTGVWTLINNTSMVQGNAMSIELFGNNSSSAITYSFGGSEQSVAPNTFDLWINGVNVGNDLLKNKLPNAANIDSFMFYGYLSAGNVANLFIDDITYQNDINPVETLPVELTSFTAVPTIQNTVRLDWITQSESGVSGYYILRNNESRLSGAEVISPLIEPTNTATTQAYSFTDSEVQNGSWYYWLQLLDLDGQQSFHGPISVVLSDDANQGTPVIPLQTGMQSIYPNPFNPSTTISFSLAKSETVMLEIFNTRGQKIKTLQNAELPSGNYSVTWNGKDNTGNSVSSGIYLIRMSAGANSYCRKAMLSK